MHPSNNFRDLLFPLDDPRFVMSRSVDPREFGKMVRQHPRGGPLLENWDRLSQEPFHGLTCDGKCEHGLFDLEDEGAPVAEAAAAANELLRHLDQPKRDKVRYPMDAHEWRRWSNPEFLWNDNGLRLEDLPENERLMIMRVLAASMGGKGYAKAQGCMRVNAFLGELTQLQNLMNEWSYNFLLFGEPSPTEPWGWQFFGHHLCLNCAFIGGQMVISPVFMGAEPNVIDEGPYKGLELFTTQETVGLSLMQSLSQSLKDRAQTYKHLHDEPSKPAGRWHRDDGMHLGGAFQDNRVVPYEGIPATEFDAKQRTQMMEVAEAFLELLPDGPRANRLSQIERHLDRTYWSWIGGYGEEDPFYYRIQSPIIMLEFDHHAGIWLNNELPAKCHIHTVIRTPNGNDYGKDLLRQHYESIHPGQAPGR
jgi:Protein of unknown function (DUF3500)